MSSRLAARLARREVARRRGRTALVTLLVALPVAGMAVAFTLQRTDERSGLDEWHRTYGDFDAVTFPSLDEGVPPLPEGSSVVVVRTGSALLRAPDGERTFADVTDLPAGDRRLRGATRLLEGRAPRTDGEIALSPELAGALDVGVGERLELDQPEVSAEVVGLAEQTTCLSCHRVLLAPGQDTVRRDDAGTQLLIDLPRSLAPGEQTRLEALPNIDLRSRWASQPASNQVPAEQVAWTFVGGALVLTVMGIVITAAFAVGARRQLATLGQLSANGAAPRTLAGALVLQGTFTGAVGAAAGLGLAWAVLAGGRRYVELALDHRIERYTVAPWPLAGAVAVGVTAATVAALLPARTAARVPTLQAMAGRRPLSPVPRRLTIGGIVAVAGGLGLLAVAFVGSQSGRSSNVWAALAVAGGVAELLGACAAAPVVVARLEPLARRLRGTGRLAARSLARQRTRSGAVISAVCAAGALAVCAATVVRGAEVRDARDGRLPDRVVVAQSSSPAPAPTPSGDAVWLPGPPTPEAAAAVADALPRAEAVPVRVAVGAWRVIPSPASWDDGGTAGEDVAVVGDDAVLDAFEVDDDVREVLDDRGVVVLHRDERDVTVELDGGRSWVTRTAPSPRGPEGLSTVLVSPLTARAAGVDVRLGATAFRGASPLTDGQRNALTDLLYDEGVATTRIDWETPRSGPSPLQLQLLLSGAALLFSVLVVGASLALAAAESRDERDTLSLAGAPPRVLARTAGAKAGLLSVLGGLLALPIGFLPVVVFTLVDVDQLPLRVPWPTVGALVAAVPVVAAAVAWLTSGAAQRLRPVRVSTAVFD